MVEEYRTTMYSVGKNGEVMTHRFPWDANSKFGMQKLRVFEAKGFTFEDPRKGLGIPKVVTTQVLDLEEPQIVIVPPLYISDKPPKVKRRKKVGG